MLLALYTPTISVLGILALQTCQSSKYTPAGGASLSEVGHAEHNIQRVRTLNLSRCDRACATATGQSTCKKRIEIGSCGGTASWSSQATVGKEQSGTGWTDLLVSCCSWPASAGRALRKRSRAAVSYDSRLARAQHAKRSTRPTDAHRRRQQEHAFITTWPNFHLSARALSGSAGQMPGTRFRMGSEIRVFLLSVGGSWPLRRRP